MKDKHGNKIEVGDTVRFSYGLLCKIGVVTETGIQDDCDYYYRVDQWDNGDGNCSKHFYSQRVEIIKKANTNDLYESALDSVNTLVICLCSGGYEQRSQRDIELSKDLQKLLEKHNRSN